jgi:murein DD-endopeptidase MepM/ murein hydrolase activator NlpD
VGYRPGRGVGAGRKPERGVALPLFLALLAVILAAAWLSGALDYGVWWATNSTPPAVTLAGPPDVVRGRVPVDVAIAPHERARVVDARIDGRPLEPNLPLAVDTSALPDGEHRLTVTAEDESWRRNRGEASLVIRSDNTPPRLTLESRPERVGQGQTWLLRVRASEPAAIQARLGGQALDLQAGDGFGWAVLGFSPDAESKSLPLVVEGADPAGNRAGVQATLQVVANELPLDKVEVPARLLSLLGPEVRADEDRRLAPTYEQVTRPRLWEGRFLLPVQGPVITEFGTQRSYNGGPVVGHHAGVDFAAPAGRPVVAPNRGRVVRIDELPLRGKVVILDHGLGVFTTYAHLESVDVEMGRVVERGQPFAKVGNTGLSTGPHLHWELWVRGANVSPIEWTERDLP